MEKYFKIKSKSELSPPPNKGGDSSKKSHVDINLFDLPSDPGLRPRIMDYNPNYRDQIRRAYLQQGPCQPRDHNFPQKEFGIKLRRFNKAWFSQFGNWLEYSVAKDVAFCLCCYLFKSYMGEQSTGETFVISGFSNWKRIEKFQMHVGGVNSSHNKAWRTCQDLLNSKQSIESIFFKQSD